MRGDACHIIREQLLHVALEGTESEGLALQRTLPALCRDWITPAIEQVLERNDPEGHLLIGKLELDVGALALRSLEQELPKAVAEALERALRQLPLPYPVAAHAPADISLRSAEELLGEAFLFFLRSGTLPWFYRLPEGRELEEVLIHSWLADDSASRRESLVAVVAALSAPVPRRRLLRQFSPTFLQALMQAASPQAVGTLAKLLAEVREIPASPARQALEQAIWDAAFALLAAGKAVTEKELLRKAWSALRSTLRKELDAEMTAGLAEIIAAVFAGDAEVSRAEGETRAAQGKGTATAPEGYFFKDGEEGGVEMKGADPKEGLYVENAGLILLHPFLPRLFEKLGIAADEKLLDPGRAVSLLHYLASGQSVTPEYRAVLCKVLCSVPLGAPLEAEVDLTAAEREEAVALLQAVIDHWGALGNTSPDALRGTFLLRSGKVSLRDDGDWLLQVEPSGCDILLEELPWGISLVKLPWMERMLWVEWR